MEILFKIIAACFAFVVVLRVWRFVNWAYIRPKMMEKILRKQGLKGNPYRVLYGDFPEMDKTRDEATSKPINIDDDIKPRVLAYINILKKYGPNCFVWKGQKPTVIVTEPALIKEVFAKFTLYHKQTVPNPLARTFAPGLVNLEDDKWTKHRQIVNPAFHQEKLKLTVPAFSASCEEVVAEWDKIVGSKGSVDMDVWPYIKSVTSDAISRTSFGSNYKEGQKIFELQKEQSELVAQSLQSIYIPGSRFLPTKKNRKLRQIEMEIRPKIRDLIDRKIEGRKAGKAIADDLLGIMVESNFQEIEQNGHGMTIDDIIEECKVFYFGGQDTTSTLLGSTLFLLSRFPDWQKRAREEILSVFGNQKLSYDGLSQLKIMNMILQEVLRLYPPVVSLDREVVEDTKLGDLTLPAGAGLAFPIILLHHSREIWGDDAMEFNPLRFSEGIAKAQKGEGMYFPFGWGPRICIGQNFVFLEAKVMMSMILRRFSFELSPSYTHAPHMVLTMQPQHGLHLIVHKL